MLPGGFEPPIRVMNPYLAPSLMATKKEPVTSQFQYIKSPFAVTSLQVPEVGLYPIFPYF